MIHWQIKARCLFQRALLEGKNSISLWILILWSRVKILQALSFLLMINLVMKTYGWPRKLRVIANLLLRTFCYAKTAALSLKKHKKKVFAIVFKVRDQRLQHTIFLFVSPFQTLITAWLSEIKYQRMVITAEAKHKLLKGCH